MASRVVIDINANGEAYVSEIQRMNDANSRFMRDAQRGAEQVTSTFSRLGLSVITINQLLELSQKVFGAVGGAIRALTDAASEQEDAQNRLRAALQITGRQVPVERFTEFASQIQRTTRFNDEAVVSSVALLTSLTALDETGLKQAARGAIGLAAVLGEDLQTATLQVARALDGNAQGLKRVGIQIDETLPLQKQQQQILERLGQLYGRAEADSRTYAGATAQLKNAVADLAEEIGTPLINALTGISRQITPVLQSTLDWVTTNRELVITLTSVGAAIGVGAGAATLIGGIAALLPYVGLLKTAIISLVTHPAGLAALLALIGVGATAFLLMKGRIQEFTETLTKAGAEQGLKRMTDQLTDLDRAQRKFLEDQAAGKNIPASEFALATKRQSDIGQLERQIEERQKLVEQFAAQEFKGGSLPTNIDKKGQEQAEKNAVAIAALRKEIDQTQAAILQASEGTDRYSQAQHDAALAVLATEQAEKIAASTRDKTIGVTGAYIDKLFEYKRALLETTEAQKATARYIEDANKGLETEADDAQTTAEAWGFYAQSVANATQRTLEQIEIDRQLGDLEADRVAAIGQTAAAEKLRFENQIKYLQAIKAQEVDNAKDEQSRLNAIALRDAQIASTQTQLQQLGVASVNVGHAIADTLNDIFTAAIQGTLKFSDIGKSLLAGVARTAGDFFTQILNKKLGFENIIIDNVNGLPGQIFQAFGAGAAGLPGGQGGGQGGGGLFGMIGGFLSNILGDFGRPAGVSGPLLENGNFLSGGGSGFGGILGNIGGSISGLFGTSGQGSGLGGIGRFFSDIFGGNSSLGAFGGPLLGGLGSLLISAFTGGFGKGQLGGTIGSAGGAAIGAIFGPIGSLLGGIIGKLLGGLFNQIPNPTVFVKSVLQFYYDAVINSFGFFQQSTITKFKDISGGKAKEVLAQHQQILNDIGGKFTDLLNIFPSSVHDIIAAQLDDANRALNDMFGQKKYSEGGRRNIQKELEDLKEKEGPLGFFVALRGAIGAGLNATLAQSGFNFSDIIGRQFPLPPNPTPRDFPFAGGVPGLLPPEGSDAFNKFIDALQKFVSFTGTLSAISPRGVSPFLTGADQDQLQAEIQRVLESPGEGFADAVDKMLTRVQPLADFLKQSVTESTDLFGRGLMAAFDAATDSGASRAFLDTLHEGVREKILSGITESFIASAQFTDLLAPIQQTIRDFTQQALATGQTPDIDAFRRALLPAIEDISTRSETLDPLVQALRDLIGSLGLLTDQQQTNSAPHVEINIENYGNDMTPQELARRISDLLNGSTAPPS